MAEQSVKDTPETQGNQPAQDQNNQPKQKTVKLIIKRQDNSESKPYELFRRSMWCLFDGN